MFVAIRLVKIRDVPTVTIVVFVRVSVLGHTQLPPWRKSPEQAKLYEVSDISGVAVLHAVSLFLQTRTIDRINLPLEEALGGHRLLDDGHQLKHLPSKLSRSLALYAFSKLTASVPVAMQVSRSGFKNTWDAVGVFSGEVESRTSKTTVFEMRL